MSSAGTTIDPKAAIAESRDRRAALPKGERGLAAGEVNRELVVALAEKYPAEKLLEWFDELRVACYKGQPDYRTRLAAFKLMLEYLIGKPVERSESVTINLDADATLGIEERLAKSPALREQLRKSLEAAEAAAAGQVVEVSQI
jgi:hypothetical protein